MGGYEKLVHDASTLRRIALQLGSTRWEHVPVTRTTPRRK